MIRKIIYTLVFVILSFVHAYGQGTVVKIDNLFYVLYNVNDKNEAVLVNWETSTWNGTNQTNTQGNGHYVNDIYKNGCAANTKRINGQNITEAATKLSGKITIPYEISYGGTTYKVIFQDVELFIGCTGITEIEVDTENVPNKSFEGISTLKSIVFGEHVKTLGSMSLGENRSVLESITFKGNQVQRIPGDFISDLNGDSKFNSLVFEKGPLPEVDGGFFNKFQNVSGDFSITVPPGVDIPGSWSGMPDKVKDKIDDSGSGGSGGGSSTDPIVFSDPSSIPSITAGSGKTVTYNRYFANATNWQALYLPFTMKYDEWSGQVEIAKIMNIHRYDDDNDGTNESWMLEIKILRSGETTKANYPYLIRALSAGDISITAENSTVVAPKTYEAVTCWSTEVKYTFAGVATDFKAWEIGKRYYILSGGKLKRIDTNNTSTSLRAFRWYMRADITDEDYQMSADGMTSLNEVRIRVVGEDFDDATNVESVNVSGNSSVEYTNLNGVKLQNPQKGINIVKMSDGSIKKIFIK